METQTPAYPTPGKSEYTSGHKFDPKIQPKSEILTIMFIKLSTMFHLCVELAYRVVPFVMFESRVYVPYCN